MSRFTRHWPSRIIGSRLLKLGSVGPEHLRNRSITLDKLRDPFPRHLVHHVITEVVAEGEIAAGGDAVIEDGHTHVDVEHGFPHAPRAVTVWEQGDENTWEDRGERGPVTFRVVRAGSEGDLGFSWIALPGEPPSEPPAPPEFLLIPAAGPSPGFPGGNPDIWMSTGLAAVGSSSPHLVTIVGDRPRTLSPPFPGGSPTMNFEDKVWLAGAGSSDPHLRVNIEEDS